MAQEGPVLAVWALCSTSRAAVAPCHLLASWACKWGRGGGCAAKRQWYERLEFAHVHWKRNWCFFFLNKQGVIPGWLPQKWSATPRGSKEETQSSLAVFLQTLFQWQQHSPLRMAGTLAGLCFALFGPKSSSCGSDQSMWWKHHKCWPWESCPAVNPHPQSTDSRGAPGWLSPLAPFMPRMTPNGKKQISVFVVLPVTPEWEPTASCAWSNKGSALKPIGMLFHIYSTALPTQPFLAESSPCDRKLGTGHFTKKVFYYS